ncbi:hypothetical protein [Sphingomonas sp. PB1R3]|uniref:hypothetical protein n=1 Tax=Sphingomonas flavida TaxID=3096154 RepID=UPI002FCC078B
MSLEIHNREQHAVGRLKRSCMLLSGGSAAGIATRNFTGSLRMGRSIGEGRGLAQVMWRVMLRRCSCSLEAMPKESDHGRSDQADHRNPRPILSTEYQRDGDARRPSHTLDKGQDSTKGQDAPKRKSSLT